ncbi:hypothetical protein PC118_g14895 [Phytophthora cactorum]|uniref:Arb2 domain-containing protein n=1 Tax=Phytophthora cactorum TaxID=29920 RepID=A0A8T1FIV3_9STRA|nr:hypothetical protein PC113_g2329 [Phytophthora cactorum]KAG2973826.1 hypothetical protein PC118_g14895 [Phytophthora cactorum]KAG3014613.1 hypothetical protein PC119_g12091 [Phytophthora cactorum]
MHPRDDERGKMEALLHQIVLEEQQKMVQLGFVETCIPSPDSPARCSIFMSANWHICRRLLLVIVSGNGIQPGIWSRSLVLEATENPNQYRSGSMLPYLHTALSKGYGVVVMNPSTNTPLLRSKLAAIAFIESSHRVETDDTQEVRGLLGTRAINWQRSKESPGTQLQDCTQLGCLSLSAGEPTSPAEQKSSNTAWTIAASMDTVFAFFDSARGSMPDEPAEDELMDEMSRLSQYAYAGAAAMSSAPHQQEHMEDAEFHVEEDVGNHLGRRSNSARSSRRSMVISTSMSVNDFDLLSVVGKGAYGKVFLAKKKHGRNAGRVPVTKDIHGSRARTSSAALNANLQYVPNIFKQQEVADSPVVSVLGSSTGSGIMAMHFDDFSYMGSDIIGSRRTSVFRDSDIKMELGE